ncbi:MAG: hypothetical protein RUMPE_00293 [Eubacteriales bacterium SKADARSKE-1]|nr:hypothetical protein [Eubacteriales bacterium SKADARSKE-1]
MKRILPIVLAGAILISSIGGGAVFAGESDAEVTTIDSSTQTKEVISELPAAEAAGQSQSDTTYLDTDPINAARPNEKPIVAKAAVAGSSVQPSAVSDATNLVGLPGKVKQQERRNETIQFTFWQLYGEDIKQLLGLGLSLACVFGILAYLKNQNALYRQVLQECKPLWDGEHGACKSLKTQIDMWNCMEGKIPQNIWNWPALQWVRDEAGNIVRMFIENSCLG